MSTHVLHVHAKTYTPHIHITMGRIRYEKRLLWEGERERGEEEREEERRREGRREKKK